MRPEELVNEMRYPRSLLRHAQGPCSCGSTAAEWRRADARATSTRSQFLAGTSSVSSIIALEAPSLSFWALQSFAVRAQEPVWRSDACKVFHTYRRTRKTMRPALMAAIASFVASISAAPVSGCCASRRKIS